MDCPEFMMMWTPEEVRKTIGIIGGTMAGFIGVCWVIIKRGYPFPFNIVWTRKAKE